MTCKIDCLHCKKVRTLLEEAIVDGTLTKFAYKYTQHNVDDLVQMTATHMLEKAHSYIDGNFIGFLRVMMFRLFLNQQRSHKRALNAQEYLMDNNSNLSIEIGGLNSMERRILVKECYEHLDNHERQIWLLLKEGYIHREIAHMLDININTVHGRISRIKSKLRKLVSDLEK